MHTATALRQAAEARLQARTANRPPQSEAELRLAQHELEVHQIELEIQNEALQAAQAELANEHNLLRTLIDHLPDMVYARDATNRFLVANQTFARRMGGFSQADLIGKTDADFYPPKVAACFAANDRKVLAGGASGGRTVTRKCLPPCYKARNSHPGRARCRTTMTIWTR